MKMETGLYHNLVLTNRHVENQDATCLTTHCEGFQATLCRSGSARGIRKVKLAERCESESWVSRNNLWSLQRADDRERKTARKIVLINLFLPESAARTSAAAASDANQQGVEENEVHAAKVKSILASAGCVQRPFKSPDSHSPSCSYGHKKNRPWCWGAWECSFLQGLFDLSASSPAVIGREHV